MFKIAIFLTALDGGGAERVMLNLAKGFIESGIEVDLLLVKAKGPYLEQIPAQVKLIDFNQSRLIGSVSNLLDYLKIERPHALLTALDTNVIAAWIKRWTNIPTKIIVTVHNQLSVESRYGKSIKRRLTAKFARWFYPWADEIIAVSKGVALDLVNIGLPENKVKVIYNPIVDDELNRKIKEDFQHPWLEEGEPPVILGVGRLTKQKGFSTLIKAFALVRQKQDSRLMILGEGEEREKLEALIKELKLEPFVSLFGFVDNPYMFMSKAKLLVLSSVWEGFGNVLVEAMAAGTPVVSANCPSGPAEILEDGEYGDLIKVGDSKQLAQAIMKTLEQEVKPQKLKARASEFSLQKAKNQYMELFDSQ